MIRVLVDGVVFQAGGAAQQGQWETILQLLQHDRRFQISVLDRGGLPSMPALTGLPFPGLMQGDRAADSQQIQALCDQMGIDAFVSTGDTTPLSTPMLLVLDDLTSDLLGTAGAERCLSLAFAQRYLCTSKALRDDLLRIAPAVVPSRAAVAAFGIDHGLFHVRSPDAVAAFVEQHRLPARYVVFSDAGAQRLPGDDDDARLLLSAVAAVGVDVVSVGSEDVADLGARRLYPGTGETRALAWSGAVAAMHWPVDGRSVSSLIQAMACGCPTITTAEAAVAAACGSAGLQIGRDASGELLGADVQAAIDLVGPQGASRRTVLRGDGLAHAERYRWTTFVDALTQQLLQLVADARRGDYQQFQAEWQRLRRIQANVDFPA